MNPAQPSHRPTLQREEPHYSSPDVLGVGGLALPAWDEPPPPWWPEEFHWVVGCSYRGLPESVAPVRNLIGCNMSMRREVLQAVNGFDTGLGRTSTRPLGCEETELCIRAGERFPRGVFLNDPSAIVHHRVRAERTRYAYFRDRCRSEGVSKAWVSRRVGQGDSLSSERSYVRRTLPRGVLRGLGDAIRGDLWGIARAGAIVAGLGHTAQSFWAEQRREEPAGAEPVPIAEVTNSSTRTRYRPIDPIILDLSEPLSAVDRTHEDVVGARCLVVHEGKPIGLIEFPIPTEGVQPDRLADILLARLGGPIGETLSALGRPPDELPLEGLGSNESPAGIDGEVTVVIATRDRTPQLQACLDSILRGIVRPARVIVVDNAPTTSETEDLLRCMSADEPSLHYIGEDRPGLAVAHNAALAHIDTTKVLFTDDDVIVHPWWVARMSGALETGSKVACVTGMITPLELRTPTQAAIEQHIGLNKGFERRVFDNGPNRPDDPLFPWAAGTLGSGANMGFRTAFLRDNGGFDEALGAGTVALGGDDLAAFYDVIAAGSQLIYEPAAIVAHRHHSEPAALLRQAYGYGVGLSAHLTRCALKDPASMFAMLRRAPRGVRRAVVIARPDGERSTTNGTDPTELPSVTLASVRGILAGPVRYSRSRMNGRRYIARRGNRAELGLHEPLEMAS